MEDVGRRALRWLPAVAYAGLIFVLSSVPGRDVPPFVLGDKAAHLVLFAGFGAVVMFAWRRFWPAVAVTSLYGLLDELHQRLTPGRSSDVRDLVADMAGVFLGTLACAALLRLGRRVKEHASEHRR